MKHFRYKDSSAHVETSWQQAPETAVNPSSADVEAENAYLRQLFDGLRNAVLDPGMNKQHHRKTLTRHRTEWPYLWEKIDQIVEYGHNQGA